MKQLLLTPLFLIPLLGISQIKVAETNLKVSSPESIYYGFEAGDKVTISFSVDKKDLKEFEIRQYPDRSIYADYDVKQLEYSFNVSEKGIFEFKFSSGAFKTRYCAIKITRTPSSDATRDFNTAVEWRTVTDTNFYKVQEKYVMSADTIIQSVTEQEFKLMGNTGNTASNKKVLTVTLPTNSDYWSFVVGDKNQVDLATDLADYKMKYENPDTTLKHPNYTPLTWTALGYTPLVDQKTGDHNINYYVLKNVTDVTGFNSNQPFNQSQTGYGSLMMEQGYGSRTTSKIPLDNIPGRTIYFAVKNTSTATVTVKVKIEAVVINRTYGTREVEKFKVRSYQKPFHAG